VIVKRAWRLLLRRRTFGFSHKGAAHGGYRWRTGPFCLECIDAFGGFGLRKIGREGIRLVIFLR
jgi:hypothetical protein